ncbi:MAG: ATP-dependent Clp protease adapter ClpS [Oligoflexia bacterium]|nr:ATP-dependent Clp protease adapter ClpS [Oligoflexia bacterium]MBF0364265.1 ATP-dependent Clp protease adapter ClpS [Oligoflexia bacterium]
MSVIEWNRVDQKFDDSITFEVTAGQEDHEKDVAVINNSRTELPKRYKVMLHNDDYTTMEFVVMILQKVFHKNLQEAQEIMLSVHRRGVGVCGVFTYEVAETKVSQVRRCAKDHGFPLKCTCEPE